MDAVQNIVGRLLLVSSRPFSVPAREEGQTLVEYALIMVFVAVVAVAAVGVFGGKTKTLFSNVTDAV